MKPFSTFACLLLGLIALGQLARFAFGWDITINGVVVPLWPSAAAALIIGTVAALAWRERRR